MYNPFLASERPLMALATRSHIMIKVHQVLRYRASAALVELVNGRVGWISLDRLQIGAKQL